MNKKSKAKQRGRKGRNVSALDRSLPRPPSFIPNVRSRHTFRWTTTGAGQMTVSSDSIRSCLVVAVTSSSTARIWESFRLRRVRIWGQPPALGATPVNVTVDWKGPNPTEARHSSTSVGISPAYVSTRPPKNSSSSWWFDNGTGTQDLFYIEYPQGATIDVEVDMLQPDDTPAMSGPVASGATPGRVYGTGLNGLGTSGGTGGTIPVGLTLLP